MKFLPKLFISIILVAVMVVGITSVMKLGRSNETAHAELTVMTTFYPLYDFARTIGGDRAQVTNITPAGVEPHDFEPSPKALAEISHAKLLVYNGGVLEPWIGDFLPDFDGVTVRASSGIEMRLVTDEHDGDTIEDPHFWLDPVSAQQIVKNIRDGLVAVDPDGREVYVRNADMLIERLAALDTAYREGLAQCERRLIVTSHGAFGYLAGRYGLTVESIAGMDPEADPGAARLSELSRLVRETGTTHVFFESLVSPRLADTIAKETGTKVLVFDPIEGLSDEQQQQGKDYLVIQRENLANIRIALACR